MPFIEDENGLAIYFSREQWRDIYWGLVSDASWAYAEDGSYQHEIIGMIAKHIGYGDD